MCECYSIFCQASILPAFKAPCIPRHSWHVCKKMRCACQDPFASPSPSLFSRWSQLFFSVMDDSFLPLEGRKEGEKKEGHITREQQKSSFHLRCQKKNFSFHFLSLQNLKELTRITVSNISLNASSYTNSRKKNRCAKTHFSFWECEQTAAATTRRGRESLLPLLFLKMPLLRGRKLDFCINLARRVLGKRGRHGRNKFAILTRCC